MKATNGIKLIVAVSLLLTACKKEDPVVNPTTIQLTGTQSTAIVLKDHIADPTIPDYCVSSNYKVDAAVTVEPGVTICMKQGASIQVTTNGSWNATGTAAKPITIKGEQSTPGYWKYISFEYSASNNNKLIHCTISDGGGDVNKDGMVYGYVNAKLVIDNCNFSRSQRYGLLIYGSSFDLTGLSNTHISNCGLAPIKINANQMHVIASSNSASGNGSNYIETLGEKIQYPVTWNKTAIPFFVKGMIEIDAAVTVSPGSTFLFSNTGSINVKTDGSFNAIGTPTEPITFTGENQIPGSWEGIVFSYSNSTNNIMRYCEVAFGGNEPNWNGLIYLYAGARLTLGNSSVHDSQSFGIMNYNGTNTFIDEGNNTYYNNASGDLGN